MTTDHDPSAGQDATRSAESVSRVDTDREGPTRPDGGTTAGGETPAASSGDRHTGGTEPSRRARPARTSTAIVALTTVVVVAALLSAVDDILGPVLLGAVGAVLFGVSCWLLSRERFETVARPLVSVLTLPVALGLFGSSGVASLVLASSLFPVASSNLFSTTALTIAAHVGVVFGCTVAVLGLTLGSRNVVTATSLRRYSATTFGTALVPGLVATALLIQAVTFRDQSPLSAIVEVLALLWAWLTAGGGVGLELTGFLFVVGAAVAGLLAAVIVLPVRALLQGSGREQTPNLDVDRLRTRLTLTAGVLVGLQLLALGLELVYAQDGLASLFGSTLAGLLYGLAGARFLRIALLVVALVAVTAAVLAALTRRVARQSLEGRARTLGPLVGGSVVTAVAVVVADPVYETVLSLVLDSTPQSTAASVERTSAQLTTVYGVETFAITLGFVLVAGTLGFVLLLRLALFFRYLSETSPGYSLAGAGLFLGVVAAGTLDVSLWLVFGGIVASLLVWDVGRFGTTLGREVGRGTATRDTELVHAGGTLLVGVFGALAGRVLLTQTESLWSIPSGRTSVALLALAVGLVSFAVALR
jgi:hypothetical protein